MITCIIFKIISDQLIQQFDVGKCPSQFAKADVFELILGSTQSKTHILPAYITFLCYPFLVCDVILSILYFFIILSVLLLSTYTFFNCFFLPSCLEGNL